jgi:hypothetical protein
MGQDSLLISVPIAAVKINNKKVRKRTSEKHDNKPGFLPKGSGFLGMKDMLGKLPLFVVWGFQAPMDLLVNGNPYRKENLYFSIIIINFCDSISKLPPRIIYSLKAYKA